ncbi:hypothetical protein SKAU_G00012680 [Synaphobranchus kaupii]|uniref:Uncharacterized protein n=1 Tax=Synaphobranchus kaupii TaxID=118154 RepID=A0A9Q1JD44_SYNKA|nr:hypothetical protein SKAU_G00012680 [Synaphobranchus kaupii]
MAIEAPATSVGHCPRFEQEGAGNGPAPEYPTRSRARGPMDSLTLYPNKVEERHVESVNRPLFACLRSAPGVKDAKRTFEVGGGRLTAATEEQVMTPP